MSENESENKPENNRNALDSIPVGEPKKNAFVYAEAGGEICIEFADGWKPILPHIVSAVGGVDNLIELAPALKTVVYQEFMTEVSREITKQSLNDFQKSFVGNHFGKMLC